MKRLCVFYKYANDWLGKRIEWIVCKECQKRLLRGERLRSYIVEHTQSCGLSLARPSKFSLDDLRRLNTIASGACRCDGGNTNGCAACVATRQLENLGVRSIDHARQ